MKYAAAPEKVLQKQPTAKPKQDDPKDSTEAVAYSTLLTLPTVKWARGTGYGSGSTNNKTDWDVNSYLAAQKQKDRETQSIIEGKQSGRT